MGSFAQSLLQADKIKSLFPASECVLEIDENYDDDNGGRQIVTISADQDGLMVKRE